MSLTFSVKDLLARTRGLSDPSGSWRLAIAVRLSQAWMRNTRPVLASQGDEEHGRDGQQGCRMCELGELGGQPHAFDVDSDLCRLTDRGSAAAARVPPYHRPEGGREANTGPAARRLTAPHATDRGRQLQPLVRRHP